MIRCFTELEIRRGRSRRLYAVRRGPMLKLAKELLVGSGIGFLQKRAGNEVITGHGQEMAHLMEVQPTSERCLLVDEKIFLEYICIGVRAAENH